MRTFRRPCLHFAPTPARRGVCIQPDPTRHLHPGRPHVASALCPTPHAPSNSCNRRVTWQLVQTPNLLLKHPDATATTYVWRQMKHLKHASETLEKKHTWKTLENNCKHTQHPHKTLTTYGWNICNIQINTLVTYVWKHKWNIGNKHLQHTCTSTETSSIYFCNICMKHMQYTFKTSETLEIYTCNMCSSATSPYYLREWRLVGVPDAAPRRRL
jgi:hypothetical protein